jgi:branched-subunit amino acid aminotransferase/4-amino-4-deoxychorismate lyase
MPVTRIDNEPVGNGHPGLLTGKLRDAYLGFVDGLKARA